MAIKRIDPTAKFKVIVSSDDALQSETPEEMEALKTGVIDANGKPERNPTRYERYLETFDTSILQLKDGAVPTIFVVRGLLSMEMATITEKHYRFDPTQRKTVCDRPNAMILEMFDVGCLGEQTETGVVKVARDTLSYQVASEIGGAINIITVLTQDLKKA